MSSEFTLLTEINEFPTRALPQESFDTAIRTNMSQLHEMVNEINNFISEYNTCAEDVDEKIHTANEQLDEVTEKTAELSDSVNTAISKAAEAEQSATAANEAANRAAAVADVDVATAEKAGLVRPDGTTILVTPDGMISNADTLEITERVETLEEDVSGLQDTTDSISSNVSSLSDSVGSLQETVVDVGNSFPIGGFADIREEDLTENWLLADGGTALIADYPELAAQQHSDINWGTAQDVDVGSPAYTNGTSSTSLSQWGIFLDIENSVMGYSTYVGADTGCSIVYTTDMEHFYCASIPEDTDTGLYFSRDKHKLIYLSKTGLAILLQTQGRASTSANGYIARYFILQLTGDTATIINTSPIYGRKFSSNNPSSGTYAYFGSPVTKIGNILYWIGVGSVPVVGTTNTTINLCAIVFRYNISSNTLTHTVLDNVSYSGTTSTVPVLYSKVVQGNNGILYFIVNLGLSSQALLFYSSDDGVSWQLGYTFSGDIYNNHLFSENDINNGTYAYCWYETDFYRDKGLFVPVNGKIILGSISGLSDTYGVYVSDDNGLTWTLHCPDSEILGSACKFSGAVYKDGYYYLGYTYANNYHAIVKTADFTTYTVLLNNTATSADSVMRFGMYDNCLVFFSKRTPALTPLFYDLDGNLLSRSDNTTSVGAASSYGFGNQIYSDTHDLTVCGGAYILGNVRGKFATNGSNTKNSIYFYPKNKDYGVQITHSTSATTGCLKKIPLRSYNKDTEFILPLATRESAFTKATVDFSNYTYSTLADKYRAVRAK